MNSRLAAIAAFCRELAIHASVLAWIVVFGSAAIDNIGAEPIVDCLATAPTAWVRFADKLTTIAQSKVAITVAA